MLSTLRLRDTRSLKMSSMLLYGGSRVTAMPELSSTGLTRYSV